MIVRKNFLFIDGYNLINYSDELKRLGSGDLESARKKLIDWVIEYSSFTGYNTTIVFDAYQRSGKTVKTEKISGVTVVFTKELQTADAYIEAAVDKLAADKRNIVHVVTGDLLEQQLILGSGGYRISPREFLYDIRHIKQKVNRAEYKQEEERTTMESALDENVLKILQEWRRKS